MFNQSSFAKKHLQAYGLIRSEAIPTPISSKTNQVANQLIFHITSAQKISKFVLKFKDFLKILLNGIYQYFWVLLRLYLYKQNLRSYLYKTAFININKVSSSHI